MMGKSPGTDEGRRRGGRISQQRRREKPEYYRSLGCNVFRKFVFPNKSNLFAEFVGIVLGDGGITSGQLRITMNSVSDADYLNYVTFLSKKLFKYIPHIYRRGDSKANVLIYSGVELIKFLIIHGLVTGNKVKKQIDVPIWIKEDDSFSIWCLRGLMDTDGGLFKHSYFVNGKEYSYLNICFTNESRPLLHFVFDTLLFYGFNPKFQTGNKVWLYRKADIIRYFEVVGSSNRRLLNRFK